MKTPDNAPDIKVGRKTPDEIKRGLECCKRYMGGAPDSNCDVCPYQYSCSGLYDDFLAYIRQLESQVPKWISVEERLPGTEDPVLILVKETEHYGLHKEKSKVYYCQYLAYWDDDEWYTSWCNGCRKISDTAKEPNADEYEVTHWMPLPKPPKEG